MLPIAPAIATVPSSNDAARDVGDTDGGAAAGGGVAVITTRINTLQIDKRSLDGELLQPVRTRART